MSDGDKPIYLTDSSWKQATRIKICGVRDASTAIHAVNCGAGMIGLVFVENSPRFIREIQAKEIVHALHNQSKPNFLYAEKIGLFCNHPFNVITRIQEQCGLSAIQLHGDESVDDARLLLQHGSGSVLKALPYPSDQIDSWRAHPPDVVSVASRLLLDTPHKPSEPRGGSGRTFNWSDLRYLNQTGLPPVILAGGLTPENVGDAIRQLRPWGVDVSSGVESSRGIKDMDKIYAFCEAVREADRDIGRDIQAFPPLI